MKILFIDDEVNSSPIQDLLGNIRDSGFHVYTEVDINVAYEFLTSPANYWRYDLIIVDWKFDNADQFDSNILHSGKDFCKKVGNLQGFFTPIVMLTGHNYNIPDIIDALAKFGVCNYYYKPDFEKLNFKNEFQNLTQQKNFQRIKTIRQYELNNTLKAFFKGLSPQQLKVFEEETNKGSNANWNNPNLSIDLDGGKYTASELLSDPENPNDLELINNRIEQFVHQSKSRPILLGEWKKSFVQQLLDEYLYGEEHETLKNNINKRALNLLVNIYTIYTEMKNDDQEIFTLQNHNCLRNVTKSFRQSDSKNENKGILIDKLIARRVIFGFQIFTPNQFENTHSLDKGRIGMLLQKGDTNPKTTGRSESKYGILLRKLERAKKSNSSTQSEIDLLETEIDSLDPTRSMFSHKLGLLSMNKREFCQEGYMLQEEIEWIENYAKIATNLSNFLTKVCIAVSHKKLPKFDFTDIHTLQIYLEQNIVRRDEIVKIIREQMKECLNDKEVTFVNNSITLNNTQ